MRFAVFAAVLAGSALARADAGPPLSVGVSLADPVGVSAKHRFSPHLALAAVGGWRLLYHDEQYRFPGPLLAFDALANLVPPDENALVQLDAHVGAGLGVGTYGAGCWFDAVAPLCVDGTSAQLLFRAPVGVDLRFGRLEASFEAVPAFRAFPAAHLTFLGGFSLRWRLG